MLLSQRVAQDPGYLKKIYQKHFDGYPGFEAQVPYQALRMRIIRATKFIVGQELLFFKPYMTETLRSAIELITGKPAKTDPKADVLTEDRREAFIRGGGDLKEKVVLSLELFEEFLVVNEGRNPLYPDFVKLPFDSMVLENDSGLILLEAVTPERFTIQVVSPYSSMSILTLDSDAIIKEAMSKGEETVENSDFLNYATFIGSTINYGKHVTYSRSREPEDQPDERFARIRSSTTLLMMVSYILVAEALLFANIANVRTPTYTPSKKEISAVPKPLQTFYTYRILDIFRERTRYESMAQIKALFNRSEQEVTNRRAHMVRGHFKRKNGKLFWWAPFLRNRRNKDSVGFVDKDYRLIDHSGE